MIHLENIIQDGIQDDIVTAVLLHFYSPQRFLECTDAGERMVGKSGRCSAHEIAVKKAVVPRPGKHPVFEIMMRSDIAEIPIGEAVQVDDMFLVI